MGITLGVHVVYAMAELLEDILTGILRKTLIWHLLDVMKDT